MMMSNPTSNNIVTVSITVLMCAAILTVDCSFLKVQRKDSPDDKQSGSSGSPLPNTLRGKSNILPMILESMLQSESLQTELMNNNKYVNKRVSRYETLPEKTGEQFVTTLPPRKYEAMANLESNTRSLKSNTRPTLSDPKIDKTSRSIQTASNENLIESHDFVLTRKSHAKDDLGTICGEDTSRDVHSSSLPEVVFKCFPCNCSQDTYGHVNADCSYLGLTYLPDSLPLNVVLINMSNNLLNELHTSTVTKYSKLVYLDLGRNRIRHIIGGDQQQATNLTTRLKEINLYFNNISYIQDEAFSPFINLRLLQLSMNKLVNITDNMFTGLKHLCLLDLSKNDLKYIQDNAFGEFANLQELYLNSNKRLGYHEKRLKPIIFQNLKTVKILHIQGCSINLDYYPNGALSQMPELKELSVDGINNKTLFSKQMIHLQKLSFGPHALCNFKNISNKLFKNVPNLRDLSFEHCLFHAMEPGTFQYNSKIESFSLIHINTYDLDTAFEDLVWLQNSSLKTLKLVHLYHWANCRILSRQHGEKIQNMKLEVLDLSENHLVLLSNEFLYAIPRTLKRLVVNSNKFAISGNLWNRMDFLVNLNDLDISCQNSDWRGDYSNPELSNIVTDSAYPSRPMMKHTDTNIISMDRKTNDLVPGRNVTTTYHVDLTLNPERINSKCSGFKHYGFSSGLENRKILLPPNLKTVVASMYIGFGETLLFHNKLSVNKLTNLIFPNAFMTSWGRGRLPITVEFADFSYNHCSELYTRFFPVNNSLLHFNIRRNNLGVPFAEDTNGELLYNLKKLRHLDIASNGIFRLSGNFFKGLSELLTLDLSENKLRILNLTLSHLKLIRSIDLGKNSIYYISQQTRDDLDQIASYHELSVNFKDNSIPCTCEGLSIIKWMSETKVLLTNKYFLTCINFKGKMEPIGDIRQRFHSLQRACTSSTIYLVAACISGVLFLLLVTAGVVYRQRWKLRYLKNRYLAKWLGFQPKGPKNSSFKFDAFVLYDPEDEDFVLQDLVEELQIKRGHKICIEDRDFIPGTFVTNNIACAIQNSTVTLLVVSSSSLASNDVEYAVQMAILEEYYSQTKRPVLHLLLYQQTDNQHVMYADLLAILRKGRFLEHPLIDDDDVSNDVIQGFWNALSDVIGHTTNAECRPCLDPGN